MYSIPPKDRLIAYRNVLEHMYSMVNKGLIDGFGLCSIFTSTTLYDGYNELYMFSEVWKRKPQNLFSHDYWFPLSKEGYEKRLAIMEEAYLELAWKFELSNFKE